MSTALNNFSLQGPKNPFTLLSDRPRINFSSQNQYNIKQTSDDKKG